MRTLAVLAVRTVRITGRSHGYQHAEVTLADGTRAFAKLANPASAASASAPTAPAATVADAPTAFAAEARSLRWLAEAAAVPVPAVLAVDSSALVIAMVDHLQPTQRS